MRTFLGYTLSLERPPLHGFNYASTTQLCHESTAFPSVFLCPYFATLNTVGEKSGLTSVRSLLIVQRFHAGQFLGFQKFQWSAGAGGDVGDLVGRPGLIDGA